MDTVGGDGLQGVAKLSGGVDIAQPVDAGQHAEPAPDTLRKLLGGLAGKRQTQHLLWGGQAVCHQPHHARRHGFGFARARARDHQHRSGVGADHRRLLFGGREFLP